MNHPKYPPPYNCISEKVCSAIVPGFLRCFDNFAPCFCGFCTDFAIKMRIFHILRNHNVQFLQPGAGRVLQIPIRKEENLGRVLSTGIPKLGKMGEKIGIRTKNFQWTRMQLPDIGVHECAWAYTLRGHYRDIAITLL